MVVNVNQNLTHAGRSLLLLLFVNYPLGLLKNYDYHGSLPFSATVAVIYVVCVIFSLQFYYY